MSTPLRGEDAWLADALAGFGCGEEVVLGLGHDCAAVHAGDPVVVSKDVLVDGVHFRLTQCGPAAAARKALAVNLSDLAAAAAVPVGFLVGAVLPRPADRSLFDGLMAGFRRAAETFGIVCLGGDTNTADGPLVLSVTVLGRPGPAGVLSRTGAQVGDVLSVTGALGGSDAGRHLTFEPRLDAAQVLARLGVPHAMMDLSDGLARDLPRLCRASGVGAIVEAEALPAHTDAQATADRSVLDRVLFDGEDFELLLAHAPVSATAQAELAAHDVRLHPIGRIVAGEDVRLRQRGTLGPWPVGGWDHLGGA